MVLVFGYLGFWLGNLVIGVDVLCLVYGEQCLEWWWLLLVEGEVIGWIWVIGLVDKGVDKGVLFYSEKVFSDVFSGEVLVVVCSIIFFCGDGGFGGFWQVLEMLYCLFEWIFDL